MGQSAIRPELLADITRIVESSGCELVHAEFERRVLRIFLDRSEGVTHADCETVSKQLSALLDVSEFGDRGYVLEVSSPGLDRKLYSPKDYQRFCGRLVRVTYFAGAERHKVTIVGRLEAFRPEDGGTVVIRPPDAPEPLEIALADVKVARLEVEL